MLDQAVPRVAPLGGVNLRAYAAATATAWDGRAEGRSWVQATGSLLKVDLSGFTRLAERLVRSEITGAEHLNTVLNDVFVSLIEEIHARGGDVLQFGGDALLVWFEGPEEMLSHHSSQQTPKP